jgi:hypothetical protein
LLHVSLLRQLNVVIDDSAGSPEQAFAMLAQNRVAAVVTQQGEGEAIIARKYKGEIDMLPTPLIATPMYLSVNRQFYQRHQAQVDSYWEPCARCAALGQLSDLFSSVLIKSKNCQMTDLTIAESNSLTFSPPLLVSCPMPGHKPVFF